MRVVDILKDVCIASYGESAFERRSEKSVTELCADACVEAIKRANLEKKDVDGLLAVPDYVGPDCVMERASKVADYLGLRPKLMSTMDAGGVATYNQILYAAFAVATGYAKAVLCISGGKFRARGAPIVSAFTHPEFEAPYGLDMISAYALPAVRHMQVYGTTEEQLASVVVSQRKWASKNPNAIFWEPIDIDDVLKSPMVAYPYRLLMCSRPSDGAGALLITSTKMAKELGIEPVRILGVGEYHTHGWIMSIPDLLTLGSREVSLQAYKMAGIKPKDVDVLYLTDPFAFLPIEHLEDCGFVPKGEGGKFFEEGRGAPGGDLPVNTHGGLLCGVHDGIGPLIHHTIEAVKQLRGEAKRRQVDKAEKAFVQMHGGLMQHHAALILGR